MKRIFPVFCLAVTLLLGGKTTSMAIGWTNKSPNGSSTFYYVAYGHNCFIAVDYGGGIYKSTDYGQTWTLKTTVDGAPAYIAYGNGKFIATDNTTRTTPPYGGYEFYSTDDGNNWTKSQITSNSSAGIVGITYGTNGFVTADNDGSGSASIFQSSNGTSWTQVKTISGSLSNVGYGNGTYVAVGSGCIFTSTDASTWTSRTSPTAAFLQGVAYGNGIFVAVAFTGAIIKSTDNGVSWTSVTSGTSSDLNGVAYGNGYFYAVGTGGLILKSTDGTTWSSEASGVTDNLWGIDYGNGYFVATGENGAITVNNVPAKPTITTTAASSITINSVTLGGDATEDGSLTVVEKGVVYALSSANTNPQIEGTGVTKVAYSTGGTGSFNQPISSLSQGTSYHYNAYATNSQGTSYGTATSFTTLKASTVTTQAVNNIGTTTATGNGNLTDLGVPNPTAHGVCWNTTGTPSISNSITDNGTKSSTGTFTASMTGLTANTTYHVRAFATNTAGTSYGDEMDFTTLTAGTWTGTTSSDWSTAANWAGGAVPTSATDVTIPDVTNDPIIGATTTASCNNLTVTGSLTIESSAAGNGSLIVSGTPSGNVIYNRHLTGGASWHLIAAPVSGQSIQTFVQAAGNGIATNSDKYGVGQYTENTNVWNLYTTGNIGTAGNFTMGKGYEALRTADGTVTFTGIPVTSGSATLVRTAASNAGWNLVGNPFTSYMNGNTSTGDANNFLTVNSASLQADFVGLYYWTGAAYEVINQSSGANYMAPGQGFFVRAIDNSGKTVSFTSAMRTHTSGTFKSTSVPWPEIELTATASGKSSKTVIRFHPDMTLGLDPGYDAGAFDQSPDFGISTRLVEDSGVNFAIQCLPEEYDNLVIPVGVASKTTSGDITFNFQLSGLDNQTLQFEDHKSGVLRTIDSSNGSYTVTIEAGEPVYGRFFLHLGQTSSTGITEIQPIKAWYSENKIIIEGITEPGARAELYDLQGRKLFESRLENVNQNRIAVSGLKNGIYLIHMVSGRKVQTAKVTVMD